jgi:hypothetical protein
LVQHSCVHDEKYKKDFEKTRLEGGFFFASFNHHARAVGVAPPRRIFKHRTKPRHSRRGRASYTRGPLGDMMRVGQKTHRARH